MGYLVAAPSSFHEFVGPEPLAYDGPGTDAGNDYKIKKVGLLLIISPFTLLPRPWRPFQLRPGRFILLRYGGSLPLKIGRAHV